ncbi:MAG: DNA repair protein RadC [Clostridia bacterium]|nr:DNA repair protein RadC [Clostridia bacterium]
MKNKPIHTNHRERMRGRALFGLESFADHELLEMLLFGTIPRGDTNEIGHTLIERFGSFNAVLEASVEELESVNGIGRSSAVQIKLSTEMMRRYCQYYVEPVQQYNSLQKIVTFLWPRFLGLDHERLYAMFFNNKMALIDCKAISDGSVNSANLHYRVLVARALEKKASAVVLAHNHPHGVTQPSDFDIKMTNNISDALALVGIPLLEHLVFAEDRFQSIMKTNCFIPQVMARSDCVSTGADGFDAELFYDIDEETYRFLPPATLQK